MLSPESSSPADVLRADFDITVDLPRVDPNESSWLGRIVPGMTLRIAGGIEPFCAAGDFGDCLWKYREANGFSSLVIIAPDGTRNFSSEQVPADRPSGRWIESVLNLFERNIAGCPVIVPPSLRSDGRIRFVS